MPYPINRFIIPGVVIEIPSLSEDQAILADACLEGLKNLPRGGAVLIRTDWSQFWNTERYLRHPHLSLEAARLLADKHGEPGRYRCPECRFDGPGNRPGSPAVAGAGNPYRGEPGAFVPAPAREDLPDFLSCRCAGRDWMVLPSGQWHGKPNLKILTKENVT